MIATFTQAMSSTDPAAANSTARRELQVTVLPGAQRLDAERPGVGRVVGRLRLLQIAGDARQVVAGLVEADAVGEPRRP